MSDTSMRGLLAAALLVATASFTIGVLIERNESDVHSGSSEGAKEETGEASEEADTEEEHSEEEESSEESGAEEGEEETLFGIDLESPGLVAAAVIVSLAMAGAALRVGRSVLMLIAAAVLAFAALDIREVFHQVDESRTGPVVLAGIAALGHLLAGAFAVRIANRRSTT